ncbi:unnamed protein product [Staurois parvus]|uniref:NADH-ubiquinone oxidoreductase chain 6 n=1 Tax=Staurois parvus TaxID=386267 RepID=A0ABN9BNW9_9NEOB|nr:unnamed protein product [Staurois parvus]
MLISFCLLSGLLIVASNPSPYYAALGLVWGAGAGCLVLAKGGVRFFVFSLFFLIYLGGIMVVFGVTYCSALVAEPYPKAWGSRFICIYYGHLLYIIFFFDFISVVFLIVCAF